MMEFALGCFRLVFLKGNGKKLPIPYISPSFDGSISLQFKTDDNEFLINFPYDKEIPYVASYYGDDGFKNDIIEGKLFSLDTYKPYFICWLSQIAKI